MKEPYCSAAAYLALFALFLFYFAWLASDGGNFSLLWQPEPEVNKNAYGELAKAFLHGQTSLLITPDPRLDRAPNPYLGGDAIGANVLPDLSYFRKPEESSGHYYAYWGPLPALLLYSPYYVVTHHELTNRLALLVLVLAQLVIFAFSVERLCQRWFDRVSLGNRLVTFVIINIGCLQPYLLAFPDQYRVSLVSGSICLSLSFLILISILARTNTADISRYWPGLCGFSFALALGHLCRATHVADLVVLPAFVVFLYPPSTWSTAVHRSSFYQVLGALSIPPLLAILCTVCYNYIRFEDPFQFGIRYQMNPKVDVLYTAHFFDPKYLSDGLFDYLISPLVPMDHMPFIAPDHQFYVPSFLHNTRVIDAFTAGIFWCFPITLLGLFWNYFVNCSKILNPAPIKAIGWMLSLCCIVQVGLITSFWSICFRYAQDFLQPLMILTMISLLSFFQNPNRRGSHRLLLAGLAIISVGVGFLLGWPDTIFNY